MWICFVKTKHFLTKHASGLFSMWSYSSNLDNPSDSIVGRIYIYVQDRIRFVQVTTNPKIFVSSKRNGHITWQTSQPLPTSIAPASAAATPLSIIPLMTTFFGFVAIFFFFSFVIPNPWIHSSENRAWASHLLVLLENMLHKKKNWRL